MGRCGGYEHHLEMGKLRQPLICPKRRVSQGELLALPQGNESTVFLFPLEEEKSPYGQEAVKPALLSVHTELRPRPRAPPPG